jgi:hypothetical protein
VAQGAVHDGSCFSDGGASFERPASETVRSRWHGARARSDDRLLPPYEPHVPFVQNWNPAHTLPQPPQLAGSVRTSTQLPLQAFVAGPQTHAPD